MILVSSSKKGIGAQKPLQAIVQDRKQLFDQVAD